MLLLWISTGNGRQLILSLVVDIPLHSKGCFSYLFEPGQNLDKSSQEILCSVKIYDVWVNQRIVKDMNQEKIV